MLFEYNFHPVVSHFPIALLLVVLILEFLTLFSSKVIFRSALEVNLVCSVVFAVLAFVSGYQGSEFANASFKISDELIAPHHNAGRSLLFTIFPALLFYFAAKGAKHGKALFKTLYLVCLSASMAIALYSGYLGGQLVFKYGAAVKLETKQLISD